MKSRPVPRCDNECPAVGSLDIQETAVISPPAKAETIPPINPKIAPTSGHDEKLSLSKLSEIE